MLYFKRGYILENNQKFVLSLITFIIALANVIYYLNNRNIESGSHSNKNQHGALTPRNLRTRNIPPDQ